MHYLSLNFHFSENNPNFQILSKLSQFLKTYQNWPKIYSRTFLNLSSAWSRLLGSSETAILFLSENLKLFLYVMQAGSSLQLSRKVFRKYRFILEASSLGEINGWDREKLCNPKNEHWINIFQHGWCLEVELEDRPKVFIRSSRIDKEPTSLIESRFIQQNMRYEGRAQNFCWFIEVS